MVGVGSSNLFVPTNSCSSINCVVKNHSKQSAKSTAFKPFGFVSKPKFFKSFSFSNQVSLRYWRYGLGLTM